MRLSAEAAEEIEKAFRAMVASNAAMVASNAAMADALVASAAETRNLKKQIEEMKM